MSSLSFKDIGSGVWVVSASFSSVTLSECSCPFPIVFWVFGDCWLDGFGFVSCLFGAVGRKRGLFWAFWVPITDMETLCLFSPLTVDVGVFDRFIGLFLLILRPDKPMTELLVLF